MPKDSYWGEKTLLQECLFKSLHFVVLTNILWEPKYLVSIEAVVEANNLKLWPKNTSTKLFQAILLKKTTVKIIISE